MNLSETYLSVRDGPDVTPSASSNPSDTVCVLIDHLLILLLLDIKDLKAFDRMCFSDFWTENTKEDISIP